MGNTVQLFKNEQLNLQMRTIQNEDGSISVNAEDAAIGFGWVDDSKFATSGERYIRWNRINGYCNDLGFCKKLQKDDFIPESLFYMLGMKASNKIAQDFQRWLAVDVIPSIRKTGSYGTNNQKSINEFKGQIATLINDALSNKIEELEQYYKIKSATKHDISSYIKKRLGILRADDEYEQVKARAFLLLEINKWEDLDIESYKTILPVIDESIRVIKMDRPNQVSFFESACTKQTTY